MIVMIELWPGWIEEGLKVIVIPLGAVTESATVPVNPPWAVIVIVVVFDDPCMILRLCGLLLTEKSGGGAVMVMLDAAMVLAVCAASPV